MTDLTKITTPFGLLDKETQRALKECGGPWEYYAMDGSWEETAIPAWMSQTTYRQKPQPREYVAWQVVHPSGEPHDRWGADGEYYARKRAAEIGGRVIKLTGRDDDRA